MHERLPSGEHWWFSSWRLVIPSPPFQTPSISAMTVAMFAKRSNYGIAISSAGTPESSFRSIVRQGERNARLHRCLILITRAGRWRWCNNSVLSAFSHFRNSSLVVRTIRREIKGLTNQNFAQLCRIRRCAPLRKLHARDNLSRMLTWTIYKSRPKKTQERFLFYLGVISRAV